MTYMKEVDNFLRGSQKLPKYVTDMENNYENTPGESYKYGLGVPHILKDILSESLELLQK